MYSSRLGPSGARALSISIEAMFRYRGAELNRRRSAVEQHPQFTRDVQVRAAEADWEAHANSA
jgi:hypothetical protein